MNRFKFVTLLVLYYLYAFAAANRCAVLPGQTQPCCGLVIAVFNIAISESFAISQGFYNQEGVNVCFYKLSSSVTMYDVLLANGTVDFVGSNMDNAAWRYLNKGVPLTVIAGTEGARGFYLVGNTNVLGGWNSVAALQNQNIVVDSVDSGFVTGLRKVLADYGVTNYTFVPYGSNRVGVVQQGWLVSNGQNYTIAATMANAVAPYLFSYPVVNLAQQAEHFCPSQGTGYVAPTPWLADSNNMADLTKFLRATIRGYQFVNDPNNKAAVRAWIATNIGSNDNGNVTLIYDDYVNNPATGLNLNLIPRKVAMKNIIDTRILYGMSPAPMQGVDSMITDQSGGFVDLSALRSAIASLNLVNNYDTDPGTTGCPIYNTGTITPAPPQFTCQLSYSISTQPPNWPTGMTASISVSVSNTSALIQNGQPGWSATFQGSFSITQSWNTGSVSSSSTGGPNSFTITNANYNQNSPSFGFNGATTSPAPGNNICNFRLNGVLCAISTSDTASLSC